MFQDGNNLAGQELAVYSVTYGRSTPISFSVPVAAMAGPVVTAALQDWGRHIWPDIAWSKSNTETSTEEVIQFSYNVKVLPCVAL
jgi:hypothetical protein